MFADEIKPSVSVPEWLPPEAEKFCPADVQKAAGILFPKSDLLNGLCCIY